MTCLGLPSNGTNLAAIRLPNRGWPSSVTSSPNTKPASAPGATAMGASNNPRSPAQPNTNAPGTEQNSVVRRRREQFAVSLARATGRAAADHGRCSQHGMTLVQKRLHPGRVGKQGDDGSRFDRAATKPAQHLSITSRQHIARQRRGPIHRIRHIKPEPGMVGREAMRSAPANALPFRRDVARRPE